MFKRFQRHEERAELAEELGMDREPMGMDFDESSSGSDDSDSESDSGSELGSVSDAEAASGSEPSVTGKRKRSSRSDAGSDASSDADSDAGSDEEDEEDEEGSDEEGEELEEEQAPVLPPKSVAQTLLDPIAVDRNSPFKKGYQWRSCIVCPGLKLKEQHVVEEHVRSKKHLKRLAAYTVYAKQELTPEQMELEGEGMVDPRHLTAELDALQRKAAAEPPKKKAKVQTDSQSGVDRSVLALAKKGHKFSPEEWAKLSQRDRTAVARVQRMAKRVAKRKASKSERKQSQEPGKAAAKAEQPTSEKEGKQAVAKEPVESRRTAEQDQPQPEPKKGKKRPAKAKKSEAATTKA